MKHGAQRAPNFLSTCRDFPAMEGFLCRFLLSRSQYPWLKVGVEGWRNPFLILQFSILIIHECYWEIRLWRQDNLERRRDCLSSDIARLRRCLTYVDFKSLLRFHNFGDPGFISGR